MNLLLLAAGAGAAALAAYFGPGIAAMAYRRLSRLLVRNPPVVGCDVHFPYARRLERDWLAIRAEFDSARARLVALPSLHVIDPLQRRVATHGGINWPVQILKIYGIDAPTAASQFPHLFRLIADEPRIVTAMFSILPPGKTIPEHRGLFRGVWRYHLGLRIPSDGRSYLRIGSSDCQWREGESLLFDDTYPHSAHNLSQQERLVLFLDIVRVDTPPVLRWLEAGWLRMARMSWRVRAALRRVEDHAHRGRAGAPGD